MIFFLLSVILGMVSGVLAGLFGIGGGMVIVPVLVLLFVMQGVPNDLIMIMSVATSLATIIVTSTASVLAHHRLGSVVWRKVLRLAPGIMVGSALGAVVADQIDADVLRYIFIVFLLYAGVQMALQITPTPGAVKESKVLDFSVANLIGLMSSIVGIGGGTLTVPYLVRCRYAMRNAVAISSACGLPIAVAGTISYIALGWDQMQLPEWSLGYIYLPAFLGISLGSFPTAPVGARLAHQLPAQKLKRYFSILIFLMAAKLIWY
jgi:uncharacterized membrane protein YfcA